MKKQLILTGAGVLLLASLLLFSRTGPAKKATQPVEAAPEQQMAAFDIQDFISRSKQKLTPAQADRITALENSVGRGDVKDQQIRVDTLLANFWGDTAKSFEPYIYYLSAAAKLENSEKSLTFAARLLAEYLRNERDASKRIWMADQAIELFKLAISMNPADKELPVDMGSCYVYGYASAGQANKAMSGILALKDIADKEPENARANLLVGIGGVISGQYDKAISRLTHVVEHEPKNIEALSFLGEAYAGKGNKAEAIKWFEESKKAANNPGYDKVVDQRINEIK